jgi:hypothetical protein
VKIALIPPIPDLGTFKSTGIHLLLSHLLEDDRYKKYYSFRRGEGDYLILDNSAHEFGVGNKAEQLLAQAKELRAQEVVAPDILFDANGTVEATRAMLVYIEKHWDVYEEAGSPGLMLVPQGGNRTEWVKCLNNLLRTWDYIVGHRLMKPPVIGVSKDYDVFVKGGITTLIKEYLNIRTLGLEVHCLGWPSNLWSLAEVQKECPWVRSTDSAKPTVYARAGILLEPGGVVPDYPRRPPDYFEVPLDSRQREIAVRNIRVFDAAATDALIRA